MAAACGISADYQLFDDSALPFSSATRISVISSTLKCSVYASILPRAAGDDNTRSSHCCFARARPFTASTRDTSNGVLDPGDKKSRPAFEAFDGNPEAERTRPALHRRSPAATVSGGPRCC